MFQLRKKTGVVSSMKHGRIAQRGTPFDTGKDDSW